VTVFSLNKFVVEGVSSILRERCFAETKEKQPVYTVT